MTETDELFEGGPLENWQHALGLRPPGTRSLARRALLAILIGWVPLFLINAFQILVMHDEAAKTFFSDVAVHARFLVAAPLLILAESDCLTRLRKISLHFLAAGLVRKRDTDQYRAAVASTQKLLRSSMAGLVTVLTAYAIVATITYYVSPSEIPVWHRTHSGPYYFSLDGWWHALVSIPLLIILFLGWIWRVLLWTRLLWLIARLDLNLLPFHPDGTGGLRFISTSLRGFRLIGFALSSVAAGVVTNHVMQENVSILKFKYLPVAMVVLVLFLSVGPLTVFIGKLRKTHGEAMFEYGALAEEWGDLYKRKWIVPKQSLERGFSMRDFSATTGFFRVIESAYKMNELPVGRNDVVELIIITLLPFVPVALMALPIEELLQKLSRFVL